MDLFNHLFKSRICFHKMISIHARVLNYPIQHFYIKYIYSVTHSPSGEGVSQTARYRPKPRTPAASLSFHAR